MLKKFLFELFSFLILFHSLTCWALGKEPNNARFKHPYAYRVFDQTQNICASSLEVVKMKSYVKTLLNYNNCRGPYIPVAISDWKCDVSTSKPSCYHCQRKYQCQLSNFFHNRKTIKKGIRSLFTGVYLNENQTNPFKSEIDPKTFEIDEDQVAQKGSFNVSSEAHQMGEINLKNPDDQIPIEQTDEQAEELTPTDSPLEEESSQSPSENESEEKPTVNDSIQTPAKDEPGSLQENLAEPMSDDSLDKELENLDIE